MNNPILDEALRLQQIGLSVLPIGLNKRPGLKAWKRFQSTPADERQILDWFECRDDLGLGIVLGPVSNHVVARDFDIPGSFERWAISNPRLAETLPIVQASRAPHVYARIENCPTIKFADGELRSNGSYIVCPPSVHPSGCEYRWITKFQSLADVPILSVGDSGFDRNWTDAFKTQATEQKKARNSTTDTTESTSVRSVLSVQRYQSLIEETLPPCFGTRRHRLFLLARRVRADSQLRDIPLHDLKGLVREWHGQALPTIRKKEFDLTWCQFVEAHGNVDPNRCEDAVSVALQRSNTAGLPLEAQQYDSQLTRRLVALCAELSRVSPDGVFFLACRKAASVLGEKDHTLVARLLKMLCADGIIWEVEHGGPHTNKASRYLYATSNRKES